MADEIAEQQQPVWPAHFPPDCPPDDARELSDIVLYLIASDPPTANDFLSAGERGVFKNAPACERASLSCGLTTNYLEQLRAVVPRLRPMKIARASLQPEHGRIKQTGRPGHHSMWLTAHALRNAPDLFEVVEEKSE